MKKILLVLFMIPFIESLSYGINENSDSIQVRATNDMPDFRGVWEVVHNGTSFGHQIIWKDSTNAYQTIYIDTDNDVTETLDIYLKGDKLIVKSLYADNDWYVTEVLTMVDDGTIILIGINNDGAFTSTLNRIYTDLNKFDHQIRLFDRDKLIYGGWIPHLTFTFTITTTKFSVHQYTRTYPERKEVRDKIWELHNKGWGYTKIHQYLQKNGYEVGKSRTTVDSMIKKMKRRGFVLGLKDEIRKYENFKIEYFRL